MARKEISFVLLVFAIIILGINGVDGLSVNVARMMMFVFMLFVIISFTRAVFINRRKTVNDGNLAYLINNQSVKQGGTMFFSSRSVESLTKDHTQLRKEIKILKDTGAVLKERVQAYERLVPNLISHFEREEAVIYSYIKSCNDADLKFMAVEGYEEHLIVDKLVEQIKAVQTTSDIWSAKVKLLAELIELHIDEEEKETFPILKDTLTENTDHELCFKYENHHRGKKVPSENINSTSLMT